MLELYDDNYYISDVNIVKDNKTIYLDVTQIDKATKHERQIIIGFRNLEEAKSVYNKIFEIKKLQII